MKTKISLLLLAILCNFSVFAQSDFDKYFEKKSLRVDFALSGNLKSQSAAIQGLREEPVWGPSHCHKSSCNVQLRYTFHECICKQALGHRSRVCIRFLPTLKECPEHRGRCMLSSVTSSHQYQCKNKLGFL